METTPLFPPYLQEGSVGTQVIALQAYLLGTFPQSEGLSPLEVTGVYDQVTTAYTVLLQRKLGFTGEDLDGKFGPKTREALRKQRGVDFDKFKVEQRFLDGTVYVGPDGKLTWPEKVPVRT